MPVTGTAYQNDEDLVINKLPATRMSIFRHTFLMVTEAALSGELSKLIHISICHSDAL